MLYRSRLFPDQSPLELFRVKCNISRRSLAESMYQCLDQFVPPNILKRKPVINTIAKWEHGQAYPYPWNIAAMAHVFGLAPETIIMMLGDPPKRKKRGAS